MGSGGHREGAGAVRILVEDMGKARDTEDDRNINTQEGRAGDSQANSFFLDKDVPYIPEHHDAAQSDDWAGAGVWPRQSSVKTSASHGVGGLGSWGVKGEEGFKKYKLAVPKQ